MIVFGDIHGCRSAVEKAIEIVEVNNKKAIFLGDYVDRGYDSIGTLEVLIRAKERHPDWIFLRGNHDQMLLDLINGVAEPNSDGIALGQYGFSYDRTTVTYNQFLLLTQPARQEIIDFLNCTIFYYETEHLIFAHAPLKDNNIPIEEKGNEELIWNYNLNPVWSGKHFIYGHATVQTPITTHNGTNINTRCGLGGTLTGLYVDNEIAEGFYSISEDGQHIQYLRFPGQ